MIMPAMMTAQRNNSHDHASHDDSTHEPGRHRWLHAIRPRCEFGEISEPYIIRWVLGNRMRLHFDPVTQGYHACVFCFNNDTKGLVQGACLVRDIVPNANLCITSFAFTR